MIKFLVDYLYDEEDGRNQSHKEFCVKCGIANVIIGVPVIISVLF